MENKTLKQNKNSWDAIADDWFGSTALPDYGILIPNEDKLHFLKDIRGKKILDIGCGSGHSLKWCGDRGADELWGLDMSTRQIENANRYLSENGYQPRLFNSPMEEDCGLPQDYFDIVYSIYAIGWTIDLKTTFDRVFSYLKKGGVFIFSWDHPLMHCMETRDDQLIFSGCYHTEDIFSFEKGSHPVTLQNRRMSTYINTLAEAGFLIERIVEETDQEALEKNQTSSSIYYTSAKAAKFPLSFLVKARKI